MERGAALFKKATFVMDRGYDDNKMFLKLDELKQDYVIRLKSNRKLFYHNKWVMATELRNRRKGKVKMPLCYKGKHHEAYLSHVKVQITASKKDIYLVLVYGITEHPMMLATNKEIKSKDDVIDVAKCYFSRWKIEEYFSKSPAPVGFIKVHLLAKQSLRCCKNFVRLVLLKDILIFQLQFTETQEKSLFILALKNLQN